MNKKRLVILLVAVLAAVGIGLGAFFGIRALTKDRVTFSVADTLPDGGGKKATVILLGGQSNASGCSIVDYLKQNVSPEQYAEYEAGYDNVYIHSLAGLNRSEGFVKCSVGHGETTGHFGPELGLAQALHEAYPTETFFIIKCAWGGTNLYDQWLSPSSDGKTGKLYREFVAFVSASLKYLKSKHYDVEIAGMCWMQGESDSFSVDNGTEYREHLSNLIGDLRRKFSRYSPKEGFVFVDATIADNPMYWVYCDLVNASKVAVEAESDRNLLIDTNAAGLSCSAEPEGGADMAHYDSLSQLKLGRLFAEALDPYLR